MTHGEMNHWIALQRGWIKDHNVKTIWCWSSPDKIFTQTNLPDFVSDARWTMTLLKELIAEFGYTGAWERVKDEYWRSRTTLEERIARAYIKWRKHEARLVFSS